VRGCSVGRARRLDELAAPKPADRYLHRRAEAERSELAECTFAPKILHKPTSAPHHKHDAPGTVPLNCQILPHSSWACMSNVRSSCFSVRDYQPRLADRYLHRRGKAERSELAECTSAPKLFRGPTSAPNHNHAAPGRKISHNCILPCFIFVCRWLVATS
jgi:hypothetical protein